jgi:AraC-like DNA-binding protein
MISDHRAKTVSVYDETVGVSLPDEHGISDLPLIVLAAGRARWPAGSQFRRAQSDIFALECVTAGNLLFRQDGREYVIGPGQVFILRKGCEHRYATGPAGFVHKRYLSLAGGSLHHLAGAAGLSETDWVQPRNPEKVISLLRCCCRLLLTKPADYHRGASTLAFGLLLELGKSRAPRYPRPVREAISYMQRNLARSVSAGELCKAVGLSQTHFNRIFRASVGVSPVRFFIDQRMDWAEQLLSQTALSVKEIAARIGYDDPLYFSSRFKAVRGVSPRRFRESSL